MYGILHSFFMNLKHLYFILLERARDHTGAGPSHSQEAGSELRWNLPPEPSPPRPCSNRKLEKEQSWASGLESHASGVSAVVSIISAVFHVRPSNCRAQGWP